MPSRREFLQTGAVVSAIAANGVVVAGAESAGAPAPATLARAVYDGRYPAARRFAAVAAARNVPVRALEDGDITRFWYDELEQLWRREPVAIAGFTQFGPMFVVERLAAEHGLHCVLRVKHCSDADGRLAHRLAGPRETLALAADFQAQPDWPGLMAALACRVGADDSLPRTAELATPQPVPILAESATSAYPFIHYYSPQLEQQGYGPALDGPLYSWVVAPRAQRG